MKKLTPILLFLLLPFLTFSQTALYNEGKMAVKGTDKTKTAVYIKGDVTVGTSALMPGNTSSILLENSKMVLVGDFYNDVANGLAGGTVFLSPAAGSEGVFEFRGILPQNIFSKRTTFATLPSKEHNYINFPIVEINNNKHVTLAAQMAAKTKDIELTKGWLVVDSQEATVTKDNAVDPDNESVIAHLLVDGDVNYNFQNWTLGSNPEDRGFVEVRLKVPSEGARTAKSLVGFGSPFKNIGNDYFMYNTILAPSPRGFMGDTGAPITDPKFSLQAGRGYVVGIDLRGLDAADYDEVPFPGINFDHRAHNGYYFNRGQFAVDPNRKDNQIHGVDPTTTDYRNEVLNTTNIQVPLTLGYNYLSNPFTTPLRLDLLLGNDEAQNSWGVISDVYTNPNVQIANRVWIIDTNSAGTPVPGNIKRTNYSFNYYVALNTGGTYYAGGDSELNAAALQLFMVYSYGNNTITIPASERTMGNAKFLRNTPAPRRDDFIIEVKDELTKTSDRLSVVLRTTSELQSNPNYSNVKRLESSTSQERSAAQTTALQAEGYVTQSLSSQMYTRDSKNVAMSVQFFPVESTDYIQLYYTPSNQAQNIKIRGLRIETKNQVEMVYLEDNLTNQTIELTPTTVYETTSNPGDSETRFRLRLKDSTTGVGEGVSNNEPITAYYYSKVLTARGFTEKDFGSILELFDISGRLINTKIVDDNSIDLASELPVGVYLVKVKGFRNQGVKVLVK